MSCEKKKELPVSSSPLKMKKKVTKGAFCSSYSLWSLKRGPCQKADGPPIQPCPVCPGEMERGFVPNVRWLTGPDCLNKQKWLKSSGLEWTIVKGACCPEGKESQTKEQSGLVAMGKIKWVHVEHLQSNWLSSRDSHVNTVGAQMGETEEGKQRDGIELFCLGYQESLQNSQQLRRQLSAK